MCFRRPGMCRVCPTIQQRHSLHLYTCALSVISCISSLNELLCPAQWLAAPWNERK